MSTAGDGLWLAWDLGALRLRAHLSLVPAAGLLAWWSSGLAWRYFLLLGMLLLHELGHALASLALGGAQAVVSLWPAFGKADVRDFRDRREVLVALAGPGANLLAALVLALAGARLSWPLGRAPWADLLLDANLALGLFNLVPVPPADGGRVLRALRRP